MTPGRQEAGLATLSLLILVLIGLNEPSSPVDQVGSASLIVAAGDAVLAATAPSPSMAAGPSSTLPPVPTTEAFRTRQLSIEGYPSEAAVELTVTDATGAETSSSGSFSGELAGEVMVSVTAEGYRPESHTIPAEQGGRFEVFLDPPDQVVDRTLAFITGSAPKQVAWTPDGSELWVTLLAGSGLEVYNPASGELLDDIDLPGAGSVEVIFDATGQTAWVSQMETATVYEIDVATRRIRRQLGTGGSWTKVMVLSPDQSRLWASNWVSNDVSEFDLATGELVRRIPTVATPRGLATDPDGNKLYVAGYDAGEIQVIDLATGEGRVIEHTGGALRHLVADSASGLIYASDMARDLILVIDSTTDAVTHLATTDRLPNTIDLTPDGRFIGVSNRGRNNPETYYLPGPQWGSILLLDTTTGELVDAIVGGNQPTGLDISSDGRWLAYSDFLDNRVTVVALPPSDDLAAANGGRAGTYKAELEK